MESVFALCDGVSRASNVRAEKGGGTRLPLIDLLRREGDYLITAGQNVRLHSVHIKRNEG